MSRPPQHWPPLEQLLPHRPPMLLLDAVERFDGAVLACRVTPRAGGPFVRGGFVPALVSVEYFAQAAAAYFGVVHHRSGGAMRMGVLLGGVPGVPAAHVVIIGAGVVGSNALQVAVGMGARVTVLDKNVDRLRWVMRCAPCTNSPRRW